MIFSRRPSPPEPSVNRIRLLPHFLSAPSSLPTFAPLPTHPDRHDGGRVSTRILRRRFSYLRGKCRGTTGIPRERGIKKVDGAVCVRRGRGEARGQTHCRLRVGGWSAKRESVVAKAKHSLAACKRPNTESHLSVPARSMPTSAAVVRFRVARRVVATRTRRCVSRWPDQRPSVQKENR